MTSSHRTNSLILGKGGLRNISIYVKSFTCIHKLRDVPLWIAEICQSPTMFPIRTNWPDENRRDVNSGSTSPANRSFWSWSWAVLDRSPELPNWSMPSSCWSEDECASSSRPWSRSCSRWGWIRDRIPQIGRAINWKKILLLNWFKKFIEDYIKGESSIPLRWLKENWIITFILISTYNLDHL